jgi:hypothetical protein
VSNTHRYLFLNNFIFTKQVKAGVNKKNEELLIEIPCTEFHPITSTRACPDSWTRGNPLIPTIDKERMCEHSVSLHWRLHTQTEICLRYAQIDVYDCCRSNQRNSKLQTTNTYSRVIQKSSLVTKRRVHDNLHIQIRPTPTPCQSVKHTCSAMAHACAAVITVSTRAMAPTSFHQPTDTSIAVQGPRVWSSGY